MSAPPISSISPGGCGRRPYEVESAEAPRAERPFRLFLTALSVMLGNPKVMVFYLALLPNLIDLAGVSALGYAELVAVTFSS